jgi:FlaA1/EpsC-like NDP-sugar epimerase
MERNCVEAVENNVFGTLNTVQLSEKYGVHRVMMVSTDKAVNPTNVMGATKRVCEMIIGAYSKKNLGTTYSATRFGNVLGSAGSVIPLFKKQILRGGPITLTDKRIVRYFMTIPEASQLVLKSGAMAKNGELFVLDMGKPIKILELAENMIRLSGLEPYTDIDIIETGLRPGEKLYEETLVNSDLEKTASSSIFIEREEPVSIAELNAKLSVLKTAVETGDDNAVKEALKAVVPTFKSPEEVNKNADESKEMKAAVTIG